MILDNDGSAETAAPTTGARGARRLFERRTPSSEAEPAPADPGPSADPTPRGEEATDGPGAEGARSPVRLAGEAADPAVAGRETTAGTATGTKAMDAAPAPSGPTAAPAGARRPPSRSGTAGATVDALPNEPIAKGASKGARGRFHARSAPEDFGARLREGRVAVWRNLGVVMVFTFATNVLILAIPVYLFQISDRVLVSRSTDTLVMLTVIIVAAVLFQAVFDAIRRFILMRTAVEVAARLGAPTLSAAAAASLHGNGREYQTLGDLQQLRGFIVSGTLIAFLDVPFAPLFLAAIFLVHPDLGAIVTTTALALLVIAIANQKLTEKPFAEANTAQARANMHLDSMSRNSQIINALAMIPEAVRLWGRDTAQSLTAQVRAQDRNIVSAAISRAVRLLTQIAMLGWGAHLAIAGEITGGMVIAASIIAGRALAPIEGAIEGWNAFLQTRQAYARVARLLTTSTLQHERLRLPNPQGRLDVERLLYVPAGTKQVVLNGVNFRLKPGDSLAVIGNSGAGKTTLGKMLVGSILPTSGSVRLDLMDLRNWDPRQFGENIGYLPQDVQLFPGTIKANIARMREGVADEQIHRAAVLADVHEMIATLPHGYETVVAADGSPLSGGQKQRIALARAFFGDPRLIVLDEPNSNLDVAGDKALAHAVGKAKESGITMVVITQKPALLGVVDKIMLLTDGSVGMFGAREEVMARLAGTPQGTQQTRPVVGHGASHGASHGAGHGAVRAAVPGHG